MMPMAGNGGMFPMMQPEDSSVNKEETGCAAMHSYIGRRELCSARRRLVQVQQSMMEKIARKTS
jgi:hypothetical protein